MTAFIKATTKQQFEDIATLASIIWREHYIPIIGAGQVEYMLKNYQSAEAMYSQYKDGYQYFVIYFDDRFVGYLAFVKQNDSLFLSKIYVSKECRGQGIGKKAMTFVQEKAIEWHCKAITLGVNKYNVNSIAAYEAMGFKNIGAMVTDIGEGFIMDDYKMEKLL